MMYRVAIIYHLPLSYRSCSSLPYCRSFLIIISCTILVCVCVCVCVCVMYIVHVYYVNYVLGMMLCSSYRGL